jgi:hypothetical protein
MPRPACDVPRGASARVLETDAGDDTRHSRLLGVQGERVEEQYRVDGIKEYGWLTSHCGGHIRAPAWRPAVAENGRGAKLAETLQRSPY